ncbi:MAG: hypothetical protein ICV78_11155 [Tolypothrix sp. Co-bin9]|nr:hypothetical protein [Tolypothrix sp. Co-bin9]
MSRFSEVLGAAQENTQLPGYPESQPSEHLEIQPAEESSIQVAEQLKNKVSDNLTTQLPGYPESQLSEQVKTQPFKQPPTRSSKQLKDKEKLAKRENPDYTQTTFRIPKKLSRQINRVLMDLADEGVEIDRSDLLEELANAFIRIVDEVGAVEALEQVKNLGIQMDE